MGRSRPPAIARPARLSPGSDSRRSRRSSAPQLSLRLVRLACGHSHANPLVRSARRRLARKVPWALVLLRDEGDGVIAIGQASHAWISGQLARVWGNDRFAAPEPREEVCLAAEQHDVGMAEWDLRPSLNPDTGRPRSFMELPVDVHVALWSEAPAKLFSQSRYAALLVSMHGVASQSRRDLAKAHGALARTRTRLSRWPAQPPARADRAARRRLRTTCAQPAPGLDVGLDLARAVPALAERAARRCARARRPT